MSALVCRAVNKWIADKWLADDPRLRASILIPSESPEQAVDEIERCGQDPRFVQVLMLASGEMPLGRRRYWPIYQAPQALGLPIGIHIGSSYRFPPSPAGYGSSFIGDYVGQPRRCINSRCLSGSGKVPPMRVRLQADGAW
jgi:uncharacterized protein